MAGYIDTSTDEGLWSSYNGGRAAAGAESKKVSEWAQWSALMDATTCDWCGWADERLFNTSIEPVDPPMHFGCRCIVALILDNEFGPTGTSWGNGPPSSAWPPGSTNGTTKAGKPTLRNEGKIKPKTDLDKKASEWASNWVDDVDSKTISFGNIQDWHRNALADMVPDDPEGVRILNNFIDRWTGASSRSRKEIAEIIARGNADEVLAFTRANPQVFQSVGGAGRPAVNTLSDAEGLIRAWDAHKRLAAEVFRKKYPNGVTIHRGVSIRGPGSMDDFWSQLAAGDLDQAVGTRFVNSWSTNRGTAEGFSLSTDQGILMSKHLDADDVFASFLEHPQFASFGEEEVLWYNWEGTLVPKQILGTKQHGSVIEVELW